MNGEAHLPNVAVIGAGLGGLSAAIRLAATGFAVDLYERSDSVGGKAGTLTESGFRFDTGPSLVTMKDVFDDLFSSVGRRAEEYLSFVPLPVICRYFYPDSTTLDAFFEPDRFGREIQSKTTANGSTKLPGTSFSGTACMIRPPMARRSSGSH